ncbi:DUF3784 domain-containing protein [Sporosarcina gallistercoris]|uniref:DUF3784 domain-containing protein n=1 Tax=Sporosarcina gallistercoris TaxID=2762245 RepID=UPI003D2CBCB6
MFLSGFIACLFVSVFCFLFSFLIWRKKELSLISGYNEKTYSGDKEKLAKGVGILLLETGILTFFLPFGLEFIGSITGALYGVIVVISTIACFVYIKF